MRSHQYLGENGYTQAQRELFERQRLCAIHLATKGHVTLISLAKVIGLYEAKNILEGLRLDGYLIRYHHKESKETRYKINPSALDMEAFFVREKMPRELP